MTYNPTQIQLTRFTGVGDKIAKALKSAGIQTAWDALLELPLHYQDRTRVTKMAQLREGMQALVRGKVVHTTVSGHRKKMLLVYLEDDTSQIVLRFFRFYPSQVQQLTAGKYLQCFGQAKRQSMQFEFIHPEYQLFDPENFPPLSTDLTAVYPTHKGVPAPLLSKLIASILKHLPTDDYLPEALCKQYQLKPIYELLRIVHQMPIKQSVSPYLNALKYRLAFEELLAHQLSLDALREQYQLHQAISFSEVKTLSSQFLSQLPFQLTGAQQRVIQAIYHDLQQTMPMMRLVQGDVGSGKTVVSAMAALPVLAQKYQVVIMAPTEILAEQHFEQFKIWFEALGFKVAFLASKLKAAEKRAVLSSINKHEVDIIIGTHALFQKDVVFSKLGLVIIDEQHRFGVHQRLMLRDKGAFNDVHPHQLIMTATPIPRTLAMCAYADLDQSVIDELPPGRQPIQTIAIDNIKRAQVAERIRAVCAEGRQVYWVCTLIETSEKLQCEAAEKSFEALKQALPELNIALIHGRLKSEEKAAIMAAYVANKIHILVATTVIEVGVDVPNASLMVIENAERLGLSQLHQLRGRIGRGQHASFCVLLYQSPLGKTARERIHTMRETQDGFKIAEKDLQLRGPGELLGTRQAGEVAFRFADLEQDEQLLVQAQEAIVLLNTAASRNALIERWRPQALDYAKV